jgi:hypothetical protein
VNTLLKDIVGWLTKSYLRGETKISPQNCVIASKIFDHYWLCINSYVIMGAAPADNFVIRRVNPGPILEQIRDDLKKTT